MSKEPDKTENSDIIRQLVHSDSEISETLNLDTEEDGNPDSTSNPKLSQEKYPQTVGASENKLEKSKMSFDETEESKNELDCKKCDEGLKNFEGITAHDCFYIETKKSSLHISKVFDHLQEKENSKLITETSVNENISVSSTSKISSPCKISEHDSPQILSLATSKQLYSSSINTLKGDSSRSPTSSVESHKLQSRRSFPSTTTMRCEGKKTKKIFNKYPIYVTPPRRIMPKPSKELKDDSLKIKNSASKNLFESGRRSCIATTNRSPIIEVPNIIGVNYPVYVTPPRQIMPFKELKDDSLKIKNSASKNLFESDRRSCIATTNRSPDIEVPNIISVNYPVYVTPPRRVMNPIPVNLFQSPHMHNTQIIPAFSGNVVIPAPINLNQSSLIYNTATLSHSPERVIISTPVNILQPHVMYITHVPSDSSGGVINPNSVICQPSQIYSTETFTDSSGSVGNPSVVNLIQSRNPSIRNIVQSPQLYNLKTISDSSGSVMEPTPVNLQSSRIYDTETSTKFSGNIVIPGSVSFDQSPRLNNIETLTDTSGSTINPTPVNIFQTPEIKDPTTKTISTQTESEKWDSSESLAIENLGSPKPVSSPLNKNNLKIGFATTISAISPKEKFGHTEREGSDNPTFVTAKETSPTSDDFPIGFKFPRTSRKTFPMTSRKSFPRTTSSRKVTSLGKKIKKKYLSSVKPIRTSSLKTFSQDPIDFKKFGEVSRSQSPMCSSISVDKLTPVNISGKSKALTFATPK
ncbi:hypothetical protein TNCV_3039751 [Trichonephila clavipes]|uniref:Uncharacterized protein n=1 Tax=Trichonephila clavipes TaxID=2585209 RepID=A0A8X6RS19_TRICX|nr:hypothetical protein TNCV_3039751 [Trichonephila clavipes]